VEHVACIGELGNSYMLVCKPEGKTPLQGPRHRQKDITETYLEETGWEGVE
jgi:hypothetical protein